MDHNNMIPIYISPQATAVGLEPETSEQEDVLNSKKAINNRFLRVACDFLCETMIISTYGYTAFYLTNSEIWNWVIHTFLGVLL